MRAYLHFGGAGTIDYTPGPYGNRGPLQTVETECQETRLPRHGQNVTGYGSKIPTHYKIKWDGRWRRVYAACYGNAPSLYIGQPGAWLATVDIERESE